VVAACAERVTPLSVAQLSEHLAGPPDVVGRNAPEQLLMPAVIVELDETVLHAGDERFMLEHVDVSALRREPARLAQSRAQISNDVPSLGAFTWFFERIERVVLVLHIRAVEHHQDDEESLVRTHADERILLPRPCADLFQRSVRQTKPSAWLRVRASVVRDR